MIQPAFIPRVGAVYTSVRGQFVFVEQVSKACVVLQGSAGRSVVPRLTFQRMVVQALNKFGRWHWGVVPVAGHGLAAAATKEVAA